jgi:hypothetical protein
MVGVCGHDIETSGYIKCGKFVVAEEQSASQQAMRCVEILI